MPLFDLNKLAKIVQKSAEGIAKTVSDAAEKLPDIKTDNMTDIMKDMTQKGQSALNSVVAKGKDVLNKKSEAAAEKSGHGKNITLSAPDALEIIYCLMAIDGSITPEEEEKFLLIGKELDASFEEYKEELFGKCKELGQGAADEQEYYDILHNHIADIIRSTNQKPETGISGKLLLWDLYAVAYSDEDYSDVERRLIRFICRALNIDNVIALEMEQTIQTMRTIEAEEAWLRTTDRQYKEVESRMNELADRKQAIMQAIHMLILD